MNFNGVANFLLVSLINKFLAYDICWENSLWGFNSLQFIMIFFEAYYDILLWNISFEYLK